MKKTIIILAFLASSAFTYAQSSALSQKEKDGILYMREEEKLARDIYDYSFEKYNRNPFGNIVKSEQTHMDRMEYLIKQYGLKDPISITKDKKGVFQNSRLQSLYNELKKTSDISFIEALKVAAKIEEIDIADLKKEIGHTTHLQLKNVYSALERASENHLNAFVRVLKMQGVDYEPTILSASEYNKIISQNGNNRGNGYRNAQQRQGRGRGMGRAF